MLSLWTVSLTDCPLRIASTLIVIIPEPERTSSAVESPVVASSGNTTPREGVKLTYVASRSLVCRLSFIVLTIPATPVAVRPLSYRTPTFGSQHSVTSRSTIVSSGDLLCDRDVAEFQRCHLDHSARIVIRGYDTVRHVELGTLGLLTPHLRLPSRCKR